MPSAPLKRAILKTLAETKTLEYTSVHNGFFLDYWGLPKVSSYMSPSILVLDIPGNTAVIPGTGNERISFTHTRDVARYVAALLDEEQWEQTTTVAGQTTTWNEFVKIAEEVKGVKFTVTYDGPEMYEHGKVTELPSQVAMYPFFPKEMMQQFAAVISQLFVHEMLNVGGEVTHSELLDEVKPWSVRDVLEAAWKA